MCRCRKSAARQQQSCGHHHNKDYITRGGHIILLLGISNANIASFANVFSISAHDTSTILILRQEDKTPLYYQVSKEGLGIEID
jgi:hypothetical protein